MTAKADLVDNGNGLIYDTAQNITWTQDANLLATMEANDPNLVNEIIAASNGVIYDTPNVFDNGTYTLSAADFAGGGTVDWWGAQAFIGYLNSINYDGSSQWALPNTPAAVAVQGLSYNTTGSDLGELFYNELGGVAGASIQTNVFNNVQSYIYWSDTETMSNPLNSLTFDASNGLQNLGNKVGLYFAWAVSPGNVGAAINIAAVPVPGAIWLFGSGIFGLLGIGQRGKLCILGRNGR